MWGIILIIWLPAFLAFFPGITAYDTLLQLAQCLSENWGDHHPYMHTWLIYFFWTLGKNIFNNASVGIAMFVFLQMILLSGSIALSITLLKKRNCSKLFLLISLFVLAFYTPNIFMSISITKDVYYTMFFLLQFVLSYCVILDKQKNRKIEIALIISVMFSMWFRNNARYAILLFVGVVLVVLLFTKFKNKQYFRLLVCTIAGFILGALTLAIAFEVGQVKQGDRREMLSVPIRQISRVLVNHEEEIEEETVEFIGNIILDEAWELYNPSISDPVKNHVYTTYILQNWKQFLKVYIDLGLRYPGDYINAVLALDAGYIYMFDESSAQIYIDTVKVDGFGYFQTCWNEEELSKYDISETSILPKLKNLLFDWAAYNEFLNWPIVKYLILPGGVLWLYLFATCIMIYKRRKNLIIPTIMSISYMATLLLGPTVQFRYIFPIMICIPFMMVVFMRDEPFEKEIETTKA